MQTVLASRVLANVFKSFRKGRTKMANNRQAPPMSQQVSDDYKLLLTKPFSTMTKITDNLFLTGVGGMTRTNFAKYHIDFVVNITTDAPLWQNVESMRLALEDDVSTDLLSHLDHAVDKIHEVISQRNAHVLVHCIAGVSRSATVVVAYLMKFRRLDLRTAFNYCYNLRPIIRPNNGFMNQLINYEQRLFGRPAKVKMVWIDVEGTVISVPDFFLEEHPKLVLLEVLRGRDLARAQSSAPPPPPANIHLVPVYHPVQQQAQVAQKTPRYPPPPPLPSPSPSSRAQQLNLPLQPGVQAGHLRQHWLSNTRASQSGAKEIARNAASPRPHKTTKSATKPRSGET